MPTRESSSNIEMCHNHLDNGALARESIIKCSCFEAVGEFDLQEIDLCLF